MKNYSVIHLLFAIPLIEYLIFDGTFRKNNCDRQKLDNLVTISEVFELT